ncbi:hypothetical protein [Amycolatopsis dendrobii]|uniref:Uncharacterized protein n=1 Tax=Amycolatopsis dendrobii TaxID=2760662 RepID=A0A7W3ZAB0_9PSEU|nr:hypothetical protein [Amycolatopsis dendrobii]MBB1153493.1 hypothetical protein [Amycolatopsis dendrobii]
MTAGYAWIVDHTYRQDLDAENPDTAPLLEDTEYSRNGAAGPSNAPAKLLELLRSGQGREWRTLYDVDFEGHADDNRVCHSGRYLDWLDVPVTEMPDFLGTGVPDVDVDAEFGPLHDLSLPDCGAVTIQYKDEEGTWKTL